MGVNSTRRLSFFPRVILLMLIILSFSNWASIAQQQRSSIRLDPLAIDMNYVEDPRVWEKWLRAYNIVAELSRVGINVSKYIPVLQESLDLIKKGDADNAEHLLDNMLPELSKLYGMKDSHVFWNNVRKYGLAAFIGSLPLMFYFFFPRLYLRIWYRTRQKWVIKE